MTEFFYRKGHYGFAKLFLIVYPARFIFLKFHCGKKSKETPGAQNSYSDCLGSVLSFFFPIQKGAVANQMMVPANI